MVLALCSSVVSSLTNANTHWQALANAIQNQAQAAKVPAGAVVVFARGKRAAHEVWGKGVSHDTPFRWGSITKSFTALAVLDLVKETKLTLQTPVRDVLPELAFTNPWADTEPLRVVHLLELTAGLTDLSAQQFNDNTPLSLRQALTRHPKHRRLRWPPGLQHSYTNVAPGLSAFLIEAVSGLPFETYLEKRIFSRLRMANASLQPVDNLPGGFKADGYTKIPYWHMTYRGFGALNASSNALAQFVEVLLNKDTQTQLPAAYLSAMLQPNSGPSASAGLLVGYGAGAYGRVRDGVVFYGHGGDADGYRSRYAVDPVSGRGYVVVINTDNPKLLRRLVTHLETHLAKGATRLSPTPPVSIPMSELRALEGTYYPSAARFGIEQWQSGNRRQVTVVFDGSHLVVKTGPSQDTLVALGGGRFRRDNDPLASVVFFTYANALYLQGELGNYVRVKPGPCPEYLSWCAETRPR